MAMNVRITATSIIIIVLLVAAGVLGYLYAQASGDLNPVKSDLENAQTEVAALQLDLEGAQATITTCESDIDNLESQLEVQNEVNSALTTELNKIKNPRHFSSVQELADWLYEDDTDTKFKQAAANQMFFILQIRALRDGYLLPAYMQDCDEDYLVETGGNLAYIGDEIYYVWPGDDDHWLWAYVITMPSYPLPLGE